MTWAEHVATMGEKRNAYRILVGKPKEKKPLGRPRCRWVGNIKMDHREIRMEWYGLDRAGLRYGPVEDSCELGNEISGFIKCWEVLQ
jgi:E3 ubiquitin-protein ligase DOA10